MITLDTSGLFALLNRKDTDHERVKRAFAEDGGPYLIPSGIMAEIAYLLERRAPMALDTLLADIEDRAFGLDCGEQDIVRIRELIRRYDDLPLGYADAAVIACAQRHGGRVLTLDHRHFGVAAREGDLQVVPA